MFFIKKQIGVTLIELTVVLLVLVALAGVVIPYIGGTNSAALCNATDVTMQNIKKVIIERYYLDTLGYFPKKTKAGNDYNLKYLFTKPDEWNIFDPETQIGWRQGGYLQGGVNITTVPNNSFATSGNVVHDDIVGNQVLDGWGRPIIIQVNNNIARLVSAGIGSGLAISDANIETPINGNRANDDRILYLNAPTPAADVNPPCNEN